MELKDLPEDIENLILDYVKQMEYADKRKNVLFDIKYESIYIIPEIKKSICFYPETNERIIPEIKKSIRFNPETNERIIYTEDSENTLSIIKYDCNLNKRYEKYIHDSTLPTESSNNVIYQIDEHCPYDIQKETFMNHYIFCPFCLTENNTLCGYRDRVDFFGQCEVCERDINDYCYFCQDRECEC